MNGIVLLAILIFHWIADFVIQSDKDAKGKSTSTKRLLSHTLEYSMFMWALFMILFNLDVKLSFIAWVITFITHTFIDYFTSKLNKYLWDSGKTHYFFCSIGFDQILHYIQLYLTIKMLL